MMLFYMFAADIPAFIAERMMRDVSHTTILTVYGKFRRLCQHKLWSGPMLGEDAEGSVVEIDESYFGKRQKYNRGRATAAKVWVFGAVDRESGKLLLKCVPNRRKVTLLPILQKHVSSKAKIHHDNFSTYRKLEEVGFSHGAVNHSKEFVSQDGICTNTIEGVWGLVKSRINAMHGIRREHLQEVLDEFAYRYRETDIFHKLMKDIEVPVCNN